MQLGTTLLHMACLSRRGPSQMPHTLKNYIEDLDKARKAIIKIRSPQLHSQKERDLLRVLVEEYFQVVRPAVAQAQEQNEAIKLIDDNMQELLSLCHKHGSKAKYTQILVRIKEALITLDASVVSADARVNKKSYDQAPVDDRIIDTLESLVPSAALSYRQAILDLNSDSRHSWRGPATDLREALRETLDYLAPDDDVKAMSGYKQSPETAGPTMKQKVRYVLQNRGVPKTQSAPAEAAVDTVEEAIGTFIRSVYTRSSVSTHTPTDKAEVLRIRDLVRVVLRELLEIRE